MRLRDINSIREALKEGKVVKIYHSGSKDGRVAEILEIARKAGVPIYRMKMKDRIVAEVSPIRFASLDEIANRALIKDTFILFLNNVVDQRNIGACIRTAEFFGCAGVVIERRGAGIAEGAVRASAGAVFHLPIARVENMPSALKKLKKFDFSIIAADMDGQEISSASVNLSTPAALVIGGEDKGISKPVKKRCDFVVKIPGSGRVSSLNLSVAAGIMMYELSRSRKASF